VSTLLPNAITSATASVSSSTGVAPPHEEPHPEPDDYASDYLSYVGAGAIITTLAAALIYYKVPHPFETSKAKPYPSTALESRCNTVEVDSEV